MSGEAQVELTGGCQCGAVRYRLTARPTGESVCHCRMCQKASGAPFMAFAGVRVAELVWTRGTLKLFASSAVAERGFCGDCGTPLTYSIPGRDRVSITIGSLDRPSDITPRMQYGLEFESSRGSIRSRRCPNATSSIFSDPLFTSGLVSIRITTRKVKSRPVRRREKHDD